MTLSREANRGNATPEELLEILWETLRCWSCFSKLQDRLVKTLTDKWHSEREIERGRTQNYSATFTRDTVQAFVASSVDSRQCEVCLLFLEIELNVPGDIWERRVLRVW